MNKPLKSSCHNMAPTISVLPCQKRSLVHFLFPITFLGKLKKMSLIWSYCCFMLYSSTYLFLPLTACYLRGFCAYERTTLCTFNFLYAYTFLHQVLQYAQSQILVKIRFSGKVHKILRNLHRRFDRYYIGQIYSGDFAKICGLLRIYELYVYCG